MPLTGMLESTNEPMRLQKLRVLKPAKVIIASMEGIIVQSCQQTCMVRG